MDTAFILHLIRHAPTTGNLEKRYIGWTDESVLPFDALADPLVKEVWGSDLKRCRETAEILFPDAFYHADAGWRECHFGSWEQKTYVELKDDSHYRSWIDDPTSCAPPGGESFTEMAKRVECAVLALPNGNDFTVITHGGPVRYLLARAKGGEFQEQTALHGVCYTLVWRNRKAFEEGSMCTSFSAELLTANGNL